MKKLIRFFCVMAFIALTTTAATQQRSTVLLGKSAVNYIATNGVVNITESTYSGTGVSGEVIIPATIDGLPVTSIGYRAFQYSELTSVTIPNSVTNIDTFAFDHCDLTSVVIPDSVTSLGQAAFGNCASLTNVTIGNGLTKIGEYAFASCTSLRSIIIPDSVIWMGNRAFDKCASLTVITVGKGLDYIQWANFLGVPLKSVYFTGDAPGVNTFPKLTGATVYYLAGTTGWGNEFGGAPTALWELPLAENSLRVSAGQKLNPFGFKVKWTGPAIVEASTDLVHWTFLATLDFGVDKFNDWQWGNYPIRFYRLRSP